MAEEEPLGPTKFAARSLAGHVIQGTAWMVAWRWGVRLIGLLSTIILARILTPSDFGVIAMAMVVVGFLEVLADTNANLALIKTKGLDRSHVDTAWTIQVIVGVAGGMLTIALSPLALLFFHGNWGVVYVIIFLSLRSFANAFINVGVVSFQLNLDFAKDFRFGMYEKAFAFVVAIGAAFLLRSYWALALSVVGSRLFCMALSYWMSPYRPRFDLSRAREIWSYSSWLSLLAIVRFVGGKVDEFVVGNRLGATAMGQYAVALDVSIAPTIELLQPSWRAIFPVYANVSHDGEKLKGLFLDIFGAVVALAMPACFGVSAIAPDFVFLLLGSQWSNAVPLVAILAASALPLVLIEAVTTLLNVDSHSRISAALTVGYTTSLIPACIVGYAFGGMEGAAWGRLCVLYLLLPAILLAVRASIAVSVADYGLRVWRPALSAGAMFLAVRSAESMVAGPELLRIALSIAIGASVYGVVLFGLWIISGRGAGVERWGAQRAVALARRVWSGDALS